MSTGPTDPTDPFEAAEQAYRKFRFLLQDERIPYRRSLQIAVAAGIAAELESLAEVWDDDVTNRFARNIRRRTAASVLRRRAAELRGEA
jgi:hypothetical protein